MKVLLYALVMVTICSCASSINQSSDMKLSNQSFKDKLVELTMLQRQQLYDIGEVDGSGLLYQSTKAYQLLLDICSDEELATLHQRFSPAAPYIPYKNRIFPVHADVRPLYKKPFNLQ